MLRIILFIMGTVLISACGGGGGSNTAMPSTPSTTETSPPEPAAETETTYTGVFIDSPVQGLNYRTASQSGVTNAAGEYIYQLNEKVIFSIGGIDFPEVDVAAEITPLTVFDTDDFDHVGVVNMVRLLQTLDLDGIPENGIELAENIHMLASTLDVDFTDSTFDTTVAQFVIDNNAININLVSAEQAIQHLKDTLMFVEPSPSSCGADHPKVGYSGSFNTLFHDVSGDAVVIDNCTISVTNFNYDATAPAVFFYADNGQTSIASFTIGEELRNNRVSYVNDTIILKLPNNKTLDDLSTMSVWCVDFSIDFGNLQFTP